MTVKDAILNLNKRNLEDRLQKLQEAGAPEIIIKGVQDILEDIEKGKFKVNGMMRKYKNEANRGLLSLKQVKTKELIHPSLTEVPTVVLKLQTTENVFFYSLNSNKLGTKYEMAIVEPLDSLDFKPVDMSSIGTTETVVNASKAIQEKSIMGKDAETTVEVSNKKEEVKTSKVTTPNKKDKTINYTTKIAELQADVATIWKLQCQNLYNSKNLGALAVREAVQNSLDAINKAIRKHQIDKYEACIKIDFDEGKLTIEDNGVGMDVKTLHKSFLNLGGTTKGDGENVGGFGLAKAVILGCGTGFKVETQDNVFTSEDLGKNPIQKTAEYFQGTRLTIYNPQTGKDATIRDNKETFKYTILDYIYSSDISIPVYVNNSLYKPLFEKTSKTRRTPSRFNISSDILPDDTKVIINVFKDKEGKSQSKYLYVQLRGLTQFKQYLGWNANCHVVVDFQTKLDPRSPEYPFSTNREGLKAQYQGILEAIKDKISQSPLSISSEDKYKETLYENINNSVEQTRTVSACVITPETQEVVSEVSKAVEGIAPQGGYSTPTLVDRMKQYNDTLEDVAKQEGVTKQELIKQLSIDTVKKLDNPLDHSWIIWEAIGEKVHLNQTRTVDCIIVWDSILRLMAGNYSGLGNSVFYPGIVVEKGTVGLCVEKSADYGKRTYIMVNPLEIPQGDDTEIALYLMGTASHELAHFVCDCYEAHGETFAYVREAIMNANLSSLFTIIKLVKAGKLRKTLKKITKKSTKASGEKTSCDIAGKFTGMGTDGIEKAAKKLNINLGEFQQKYPNSAIYRMRLVMEIKKELKKLDIESTPDWLFQ